MGRFVKELLIEKYINPSKITILSTDYESILKYWNNKNGDINSLNGQPSFISYRDGVLYCKRWYKNGIEYRKNGYPNFVTYYNDGSQKQLIWYKNGIKIKEKKY